jgi:hypothetical protein
MAGNLRRLRPIPATLAALVGLLWAISFGAVRDFIWSDLREGMMDLRGLSRLTRAIIVGGFSLLFGTVLVLLINDFLRGSFSLISLPNAFIYAPGRGMMLPVPLVPLTLFLVAVAWSFALAGAVHSHLAIRLGVLAFFLLSAIRQLLGLAVFLAGMLNPADLAVLGIAVLAMLAVVVLFLVFSWLKPRPALEFTLLFFLVSLVFFTTQLKSVSDFRLTGIPLGLATLQLDIVDFGMIAIPFLLYIGVDIADFTRDAAGWLTQAFTSHLPGWATMAIFFLFSAWRVYGLVQEYLAKLAQSSMRTEAAAYLGALGEILVVGLVWLGVERLQPAGKGEELSSDAVAEKVVGKALWVILAFNLTSLVNFAITSIVAAFPIPVFVGIILKASGWLNQTAGGWGIIVNIAALVLAAWLARRGQIALPLYLGLFGLLHLYYKVTNPGELLGAFTWNGPQAVDSWWVVLLSLVGLYLLVAKKLNGDKAGQLFFLLFMTFLLRQTDFISSPLSPVFGFAGVGFIAFGVLWDALTSGSWANTSTPGLSRPSRIFLYLGYVILTVTVINWALTTHDLSSLNQLTGNTALVGLDRFGRPMLYAIFAITLSRVLLQKSAPEIISQEKIVT